MLFACHNVPLQNMSFSPIWGSFCLVFSPSRDDTPYPTHPHPSPPICTHFLSILANRPKHHVRGNFPVHRAQILPCMTLNAPCLPCFCASRAPCTLTHPSAPIRTHAHLFVPICITHVIYMYNLIKKLVLKNYNFQNFILEISFN